VHFDKTKKIMIYYFKAANIGSRDDKAVAEEQAILSFLAGFLWLN
jgi:hypothetical protein